MNERTYVCKYCQQETPANEWSDQTCPKCHRSAIDTVIPLSREELACVLCDIANPEDAGQCELGRKPTGDTCSWLFDADKVIAYLKAKEEGKK